MSKKTTSSKKKTTKKDIAPPKNITQKNIGDLATKHPELINLFESLNIDYCCNGGNNILEAIEQSNHKLKSVIEIIEKTIAEAAKNNDTEKDWSDTSLTDLVDYIENTHHTFVRNKFTQLTQLFEKALQAHHKNYGETLKAIETIFIELKTEAEEHLMKEEQILFPYIRKMEESVRTTGIVPDIHCGTVQHPIHQMQHEHEVTGKILEKIRKVTHSYTVPENVCVSFQMLFKGLHELELDFHKHIHLENNILFPRTITMEQKKKELFS